MCTSCILAFSLKLITGGALEQASCQTLIWICRSKIVEGRVAKIVNERALLEQDFIKDPKKKVSEVIKESVAVIGENIQVRRMQISWSHFFACCKRAAACWKMSTGELNS